MKKLLYISFLPFLFLLSSCSQITQNHLSKNVWYFAQTIDTVNGNVMVSFESNKMVLYPSVSNLSYSDQTTKQLTTPNSKLIDLVFSPKNVHIPYKIENKSIELLTSKEKRNQFNLESGYQVDAKNDELVFKAKDPKDNIVLKKLTSNEEVKQRKKQEQQRDTICSKYLPKLIKNQKWADAQNLIEQLLASEKLTPNEELEMTIRLNDLKTIILAQKHLSKQQFADAKSIIDSHLAENSCSELEKNLVDLKKEIKTEEDLIEKKELTVADDIKNGPNTQITSTPTTATINSAQDAMLFIKEQLGSNDYVLLSEDDFGNFSFQYPVSSLEDKIRYNKVTINAHAQVVENVFYRDLPKDPTSIEIDQGVALGIATDYHNSLGRADAILQSIQKVPEGLKIEYSTPQENGKINIYNYLVKHDGAVSAY